MTTLVVNGIEPILDREVTPNALYEQAADSYGPSLDRLACAYELDPDIRRDRLQYIHFHIWRSFVNYDHRCSLRTGATALL